MIGMMMPKRIAVRTRALRSGRRSIVIYTLFLSCFQSFFVHFIIRLFISSHGGEGDEGATMRVVTTALRVHIYLDLDEELFIYNFWKSDFTPI